MERACVGHHSSLARARSRSQPGWRQWRFPPWREQRPRLTARRPQPGSAQSLKPPWAVQLPKKRARRPQPSTKQNCAPPWMLQRPERRAKRKQPWTEQALPPPCERQIPEAPRAFLEQPATEQAAERMVLGAAKLEEEEEDEEDASTGGGDYISLAPPAATPACFMQLVFYTEPGKPDQWYLNDRLSHIGHSGDCIGTFSSLQSHRKQEGRLPTHFRANTTLLVRHGRKYLVPGSSAHATISL